MTKLTIKTEEEIEIMALGGKKLGEIRDRLAAYVKPGLTGLDVEKLAQELIARAGAKPSFAMVKGYKWATCININDVVVHGVPDKTKFKNGDVVSIDVGLYYQGFHTDTSTTVGVGKLAPQVAGFLEVGRQTLAKTINLAKPGRHIADLSLSMEEGVIKAGYSPVKALTGHGIGRKLHEEPAIPCFVVGDKPTSPKIMPGMVLAIEIMYNAGGSDVVYKNDDGWTIATADGRISGLFEETVAITKQGPVLLTRA